MRMGDFQCALWGAMTVDINGSNVPFCFNDGTPKDDGLAAIQTRTFTLDAAAIAAANLTHTVLLNFDHHGAYADPDNGIDAFGSIDYVAFDYFELNAEVVPEPGTLVLVGLGAAAMGISFSRAGARARSRASAASRLR